MQPPTAIEERQGAVIVGMTDKLRQFRVTILLPAGITCRELYGPTGGHASFRSPGHLMLVKLHRIFAQYHARQLQGPGARNLAESKGGLDQAKLLNTSTSRRPTMTS